MFQPDKLADLVQENRCAMPKYAPWTLEHFAEWISTQPPDKEYCYTSNGHCLISQYLKSMGHINPCVIPFGYYPNWIPGGDSPMPDLVTFPDELNYIARDWPGTFGAALERTRAAIKAART